MSLLDVTDLRVSFPTEDGLVKAVQGISFSIEPGQTLGIVGESGSGKSVSTQTIMGLTRGANIEGTALFEGRDLLSMSQADLRKIRGAQIGMIFQDPLSSLHPQYKVGWQIVEMIQAHEDVSDRDARKRAVELLGLVGIPQPDRRVDDYPHQFSGGMRQRAMIAMALSLNPKLLIADEPTTALDVTVQAQIIDLIERLQAEFNTAVIMITHDLGVVADIADDVMVMYAGRPVEVADRRTLYYRPHHPYTKGLIESIPAVDGGNAAHGGRLKPIQGQPPSLINLPSGCPFHPRCPYVMDQCLEEVPPLRQVAGSAAHRSACWLPVDEVGFGEDVEAARLRTAEERRSAIAAAASVGVVDAPAQTISEGTDSPATEDRAPRSHTAPAVGAAPRTRATARATSRPAVSSRVASRSAAKATAQGAGLRATATRVAAAKAAAATAGAAAPAKSVKAAAATPSRTAKAAPATATAKPPAKAPARAAKAPAATKAAPAAKATTAAPAAKATKAAPAVKATKATPVKATPVKATPAKATPAKATPAKATKAAPAAAKAGTTKTGAAKPGTGTTRTTRTRGTSA